MTKATHHLGVKVFVLFLVILSGLGSALGITGILFAGESGFYGNSTPNYYESPWCQMTTQQYAERVLGLYEEAPIYLEENFGEGQTNFGYEIIDPNGMMVASNAIPENLGMTARYTLPAYGMRDANGEWNYADETLYYQVNAYVADPLEVSDHYSFSHGLYQFTYEMRYTAIFVSIGCVLMFFASLIYLFCAAGHRNGKEEITLNLQDRIPLEIYFGIMMFLGAFTLFVMEPIGSFNSPADLIFILGAVTYGMILVLATLMTLATRLKKGKWWRNSITYWVFHISWKFLKAIFTTFSDAIAALPLTWKVIAVWFVISLYYFAGTYNQGGVFLVNTIILVFLAVVTSQLQKLKKAGEQLAGGNLEYRVETASMLRTFRRHGNNLNSLSKGATIAMEQKMKSERLKTELITNVSHDIKTPLTSIINYVDLLKKEDLDGKAKEYLEVLDRQSRRLKKLTEDLVEASKASTGNISTHLVATDLFELMAQAVAEYDEKLAAAALEPVVTAPPEPLFAMVDGNLMWRVLSNLLSNACKYSQPGTRVYLDLYRDEDVGIISVKNVSRDQLNINAEELTERFVRGDSARSTEGSGLGLNIARSLVELQKGTFLLSIEGDLFKAFIRCPLTKAPPKEEPVAPEAETLSAEETEAENLG